MAKKKSLKKECDELWAKVVKAKANYKSEISRKEGRQIGGESILHAHHIKGKATYRLRYEVLNGVCLTAGEHKFGVHVQGRQDDYNRRIAEVKGKKTMELLESISQFAVGGTSLPMVKIYLKAELTKLKGVE